MMKPIEVPWFPLTTQEELANAIKEQDKYIVRFNDEVLPLGMYFGMMVGEHPVLWEAVERGIPVELANVGGLAEQ